MLDKRKLINVIMEDGNVVPIGNPENYELVLNEYGEGVIQLKEIKHIHNDTYGLKE